MNAGDKTTATWTKALLSQKLLLISGVWRSRGSGQSSSVEIVWGWSMRLIKHRNACIRMTTYNLVSRRQCLWLVRRVDVQALLQRFIHLLLRSEGQRHPVPEEGVGDEVGGDPWGDWHPHSVPGPSGEGAGGLRGASEGHYSLSGGEVRLEEDGLKRILISQRNNSFTVKWCKLKYWYWVLGC